MVNELAQNYLNKHFSNAGNKGITHINNSKKAAATDKLTGKLVIENYPDLKEIDLKDNELTELTIRNCPNLTQIKIPTNKKLKLLEVDVKSLEGLSCTDDDELETILFKNCTKLKNLWLNGCRKLKKVKGFEELTSLDRINKQGAPIRYLLEGKLEGYQEIKEAFKEIIDLTPEGKLPDSVKTGGKFDKGKLINEAENKIGVKVQTDYPQLKIDKENAEKEAQQAKQELETAKTERDQLKQQLAEIRNELGLGNDEIQQQILDEIKSLKNRPTSGDYDNIKAERDRLTSEVESKDRRISELENENKENVGMTKEALHESTKNHFEKLGVKVLDDSRLKNATTAQNVERIRNEIISSEFIKLKEENKSSFYLNLGLGAIALGSLILLAWVVMRQNDLPKEEPEKKKK